jgi:signal transduction histidine kinase
MGTPEALHRRPVGVSERHYDGLGLALYICRGIVEDHGGSIRCESRSGDGATFIVELPVSAARAPLLAGSPPAPETTR